MNDRRSAVKGLHADPFDLPAMEVRDEQRGEPRTSITMFLAGATRRARRFARAARRGVRHRVLT